MTNCESFEHVDSWVQEAQERVPLGGTVQFFLISNKCDLEKGHQVSTKEAQELASKYDILFFETSSVSGRNIEEALTELTRLIVERPMETPKEDVQRIANLEEPQKMSWCYWF